MKILLPCRACGRSFASPAVASSTAMLECPACGVKIKASEIVTSDSSVPTWKVVDELGDELGTNHILGDIDDEVVTIADEVFEDDIPSDQIPLSNEWEVQPSAFGGEQEDSVALATNSLATFDHETLPLRSSSTSHIDDAVISKGDVESEIPEFIDSEFADRDFQIADSNPDVGNFSVMDDNVLLSDSNEELEEIVQLSDSDSESWELREDVTTEGKIPLIPTSTILERNELIPNVDLIGSTTNVRRLKKKESPVKTLLSIVGGGFAAIPIATLLMWWALGKDPLEAGPVVANYVPWVVPQQFQGSAALGNLPKIGSNRSTVFTDEASTTDESSNQTLPSVPAYNRANASADTTRRNDETSPAASTIDPVEKENQVTNVDTVENQGATLPSLTGEASSDRPINNSQSSSTTSKDPIEPVNRKPQDIEESKAKENVESKDTLPKLLLTLQGQLGELVDAKIDSAGIYRSLCGVGLSLFEMYPAGPGLRTWRRQAEAACLNLKLNRNRLKMIINHANSDRPNLDSNLETQNAVGYANIFKVASVSESGEGEIWMPHAKNFAHWKSASVFVPNNIGVSAKADETYFVIGAFERGPSDSQPFTVMVAIKIE